VADAVVRLQPLQDGVLLFHGFRVNRVPPPRGLTWGRCGGCARQDRVGRRPHAGESPRTGDFRGRRPVPGDPPVLGQTARGAQRMLRLSAAPNGGRARLSGARGGARAGWGRRGTRG
jgi:hypothetical protein